MAKESTFLTKKSKLVEISCLESSKKKKDRKKAKDHHLINIFLRHR